jgi:hypothetical protein
MVTPCCLYSSAALLWLCRVNYDTFCYTIVHSLIHFRVVCLLDSEWATLTLLVRPRHGAKPRLTARYA